ncbi:MAG: protein kinase [Planctomycetota bacterium]|nr:protein kinase [Planctomycetota bacterium]MDI6788078.1 protein kinase [Planctomycetota bacterium]
MTEQPLEPTASREGQNKPMRVRQFHSLDEFSQWWSSEEVNRFCSGNPERLKALKAHRWIKPWLDQLARSEENRDERKSQQPPAERKAQEDTQLIPIEREAQAPSTKHQIPNSKLQQPSTAQRLSAVPNPESIRGRGVPTAQTSQTQDAQRTTQTAEKLQGKTFGKYILEKKIGEGGMGKVYLAFDPGLNRRIALKVLSLKGQEAIERFLREARTAAKLKHPNIIPVYEVGTVGKFYYLSMEYIEGPSLENLINTKGKRPNPKRITEIIRDIAQAVDYAHKQHLIHRDIKPANILIDAQGQVYLTDFGLAKETTGIDRSLTISGTVVGTPDYMSPEQARGAKKLDHRTDVFSLGATLYHSLTGQVPFKGKELYQVLEQLVQKDPLPPSRLVRALPRDLETICLKCLEKERSRRYQSAGELAVDLSRFLQGEAILARPISIWNKVYRKAQKNKVASLAIAGAAVILLAVIIGLIVSGQSKKREIAEYRTRAEKAYRDEDYDTAKALFNKLLALSPDDSDAKNLLKNCDSAIEARDARIQREKERAEAEARKLKEAEKRRTRLKELVEKALHTEDLDERINLAEEALKIDPNNGNTWMLLGNTYMQKEDYDKAIEIFSKVIELAPTYAPAYGKRADAYIKKGDLDKGIADYTKAIELDPKEPQFYSNRGLAYFQKGDIKSALEDAESFLKFAPLGHPARGTIEMWKRQWEMFQPSKD